MTRGFVTIATGKEHYFHLAENLMNSYRHFSSSQYPFAIIADRENEITQKFDDVIIVKKAHGNYLDKLSLYDYLPYDETIYIDADSLAYADLDGWWDIFKDADDFSLIGDMWTDLKSGCGWFDPNEIGVYKDKISYIPGFNGGIYYMRRGETCKEVFRLANYFAEHYYEYGFYDFKDPADEPVLALAMAVMQCKPLTIWDKGMYFGPRKKNVELDISIPKATCHYRNMTYNVNLIHWSNYRTNMAWYKFEVEKLNMMRENRTQSLRYSLLYRNKIRYYLLCPGNIVTYLKRFRNEIKRHVNLK